MECVDRIRNASTASHGHHHDPLSAPHHRRSPVREIVDKLKHGIYEIRSRALQTLRFKLQHGILTVSDLVQETPLLAALLEWFNQNAVDGSGGTAASVSPATLFEDNSYALSLLLDLARV